MINYLMSDMNVSPNLPVFCSEPFEILTEYRVYVVKGEIKGVSYYKGDKNAKLDM